MVSGKLSGVVLWQEGWQVAGLWLGMGGVVGMWCQVSELCLVWSGGKRVGDFGGKWQQAGGNCCW